jgi:hypothetical protein
MDASDFARETLCDGVGTAAALYSAFCAELDSAGPDEILPNSNGMDAPTLNGINVPKWMCLATTKTDRSVRHEDYNGRD